jgi:hypothetical protein
MKWIYKNHFRTVIKSYINKYTNIIVPLDKGESRGRDVVNKDYKLPVINPEDYILKLIIEFGLADYFEYSFRVKEVYWKKSVKVGDTFEGKYLILNLDKVHAFFCKQNYNSLPNKLIINEETT